MLLGLPTGCGPSGSRIVDVPPITPDAAGGRGSGGAGGAGTGGMNIDAVNPEPLGGSGGQATGGAGGTVPDAEPPPPDLPMEMPPAEVMVDMTAPPPEVSPPEVAPEVRPPDVVDSGGSTLAMGLVSRWALEEGTGTATTDSQGVNPGTISGATWVMTGFKNPPSKAALRFDGNDDYVELGVRNLPNYNGRFSVAFWFRYTGTPSDNNAAAAVALSTPSGSARLKLGLRANAVMASKSSSDILVQTALPGANMWHHYVYSYDGSMHHLYLNGAHRTMSGVAPDNATVTNARIGAIHNNAENFQGDIDDVRIYNRALTPDEVKALHAGEE